MLPGRDGGQNLQAAVAQVLDLLGHDHGVGIVGQRVAGVDPDGLRFDLQLDGVAFARAEGIVGADGDAVHGRGVVVRYAQASEDGLGGDAAERGVDRDFFGGQRGEGADVVEGGPEAREGVVQGDVFEVDLSGGHRCVCQLYVKTRGAFGLVGRILSTRGAAEEVSTTGCGS